MRICVIGSGYVGLVSGVCFAKLGHDVVCVDVVKEKVDAINAGRAPIFEKGLEPLLREVLAKNFKASADLEKTVDATDVAFVAVGTPSAKDGSLDLTFVDQVAAQLGKILKSRPNKQYTIIMKSTVLPGTTRHFAELVEKAAGRPVPVGMNPEFLKEGVAIDDFMQPDRIVLGADSDMVMRVLEDVYKPIKAPLFKCSVKVAEMVKYASNAFLATKISFINEVGNICKSEGIDTYEVAKGMGLDKRIGEKFLGSGIGFGGSCFPKDVLALRAHYKRKGFKTKVLDAAYDVNDDQPMRLVELAKKRLGSLQNKKVALLGLAFKPDTDDVRESRAVILAKYLVAEGAKVSAFDPEAIPNARRELGDTVAFAKSAGDAIKGASAVFIATEWQEFKDPKLYPASVWVFDGRDTLRGKRKENYEGVCW
jgi:UDPglucose 6-dehydrogenase